MGYLHKKWYSEKELCDIAWEKNKDFLRSGMKDCTQYREKDFGDIRPDFITFANNSSLISIIEFKITANVDSIFQVIEYQNYFQNTILSFLLDCGIGEYQEPLVSTVICARWFDKEIYGLARATGIHLVRIIDILNDGLVLEQENVFLNHLQRDDFIDSWIMKSRNKNANIQNQTT